MAARTAERHGLGVDLTMGSGWCFGGPWIDKAHAVFSALELMKARRGWRRYASDPFVAASIRAFPLSPRHPIAAAAVSLLRVWQSARLRA